MTIAELIALRLKEGLTHPGKPEADVPARPVVLAAFKAPVGAPQEMNDLMAETAKLIAEAIVHLIETEGESEIVPKTEVKTMKLAAGDLGDGQRTVVVECRYCHEALAGLTAGPDPDRLVIDARGFLRGLAARTPQCPHEFEPYDQTADLRMQVTRLMDGLTPKQLPNKTKAAMVNLMREFADA